MKRGHLIVEAAETSPAQVQARYMLQQHSSALYSRQLLHHPSRCGTETLVADPRKSAERWRNPQSVNRVRCASAMGVTLSRNTRETAAAFGRTPQRLSNLKVSSGQITAP